MTGMTIQQTQFARFIDGAVDAALWATYPTPERDDTGLPVEPADQYPLTEETRRTLRAVLVSAGRLFFVEQYPRLMVMAREAAMRGGWAEVGHCFLLDAEGHGTGFMDRDVPEYITEPLSDAAREYEGMIDLYLQGGELHCDPGNVIVPDRSPTVELGSITAAALAHLTNGQEEWSVAFDGIPEPRQYVSERAARRAIRAVDGVRSAWKPRTYAGAVARPVVGWRIAPEWMEVDLLDE